VPALDTAARSLQYGQVSLARPVLFQALSSAYPNSQIRSDAAREGIDQSGLPDAGFSSNKNDLTFTRKHLLKPVLHSRQCFIATNKSPGQVFAGQTRRRSCSDAPDPAGSHLFAFCELTDKAIAATMRSFNEARRLWIIVESLPELTNRDLEDGVADKGFGPDGVQEFLFGDELAATLEEIVQHCERLGSEFYCLRSSPQTLVDRVEAKGIEDYLRFVPHGEGTLPKFASGLRVRARGLRAEAGLPGGHTFVITAKFAASDRADSGALAGLRQVVSAEN
jgi:hypothetical protein